MSVGIQKITVFYQTDLKTTWKCPWNCCSLIYNVHHNTARAIKRTPNTVWQNLSVDRLILSNSIYHISHLTRCKQNRCMKNIIIMATTSSESGWCSGCNIVSFIAVVYSIYCTAHQQIRTNQRKLILLSQRGLRTSRYTDLSKRKVYTNRNRQTRPHTHWEARPRGVVYVVMCFRLGLCVRRWWAG